MKRLLTSLWLCICVPVFSFAQNCATTITSQAFQNGFNQVAVQPTNQKKLDKSVDFLNTNNCLLSAQVKTMAQLFTDDNFRLEFCKQAYVHTFDQVNFYDVYDAFTAFSFAFRLHDYVHSMPVVNTPPPPPAQTGPVFPNYAYPPFVNYNGKKGCSGPVVSEEVFMQIAQNVFAQPTDESRFLAIQTAQDRQCFSFGHMMKLTSLIQSESMRMRMLTSSFARVYDQENYQSGIVLFSNTASQNEWIAYAKAYLTPPPPECKVSDADFNSIMNTMRGKHFPDEKKQMVSLIAKDRCFSVAQINTISKEFAFGDDKMIVFKSLYAKCTNQQDYYKLVDELTFSSEKDELSNFIKNGGK